MSPYALFVAFVLAVCVGLGIGVLLEAIARWASRNVDRMVDEGLAILTATDIAADTLARAEVERQEAAMVRRVELTVLRVKGEGS